MRNVRYLFLSLMLAVIMGFSALATAEAKPVSEVGAGGYDLLSYQEGEPVRGSGFHQSTYDGVTYLFSSEENKEKFEKDPEKYLPEYGGYCAMGVAMGKKLPGDPEVWKIKDGKLYFNVNGDIQKKWKKEIDKNIETADQKWQNMKSY